MATPTQTEIVELLSRVFSESLPHRTLPAADAVLFGPDGVLDSMDLVNFAADVEDEVNDTYDADVIVADARALSRTRSPFRSIEALGAYCLEQLGGPKA